MHSALFVCLSVCLLVFFSLSCLSRSVCFSLSISGFVYLSSSVITSVSVCLTLFVFVCLSLVSLLYFVTLFVSLFYFNRLVSVCLCSTVFSSHHVCFNLHIYPFLSSSLCLLLLFISVSLIFSYPIFPYIFLYFLLRLSVCLSTPFCLHLSVYFLRFFFSPCVCLSEYLYLFVPCVWLCILCETLH